MTDKAATLGVEGTNHQFMLLEGSVGPEVIDIRKLYGETGMFTYDPGFTSTASCESAITYIDGEKGILLHRGYPIDQLATFYRGFRRDAHPMAVLCGVVGALSSFYHDSTDITDPEQRMIASHRLIAKMPTLVAMAFKYSLGQPFMYPQNSLSYTGNFLRMTFGVPAEPYEVNPIIENAMRRIFILHADHEQNASTSTVRLASSSGANPFACIAA